MPRQMHLLTFWHFVESINRECFINCKQACHVAVPAAPGSAAACPAAAAAARSCVNHPDLLYTLIRHAYRGVPAAPGSAAARPAAAAAARSCVNHHDLLYTLIRHAYRGVPAAPGSAAARPAAAAAARSCCPAWSPAPRSAACAARGTAAAPAQRHGACKEVASKNCESVHAFTYVGQRTSVACMQPAKICKNCHLHCRACAWSAPADSKLCLVLGFVLYRVLVTMCISLTHMLAPAQSQTNYHAPACSALAASHCALFSCRAARQCASARRGLSARPSPPPPRRRSRRPRSGWRARTAASWSPSPVSVLAAQQALPGSHRPSLLSLRLSLAAPCPCSGSRANYHQLVLEPWQCTYSSASVAGMRQAFLSFILRTLWLHHAHKNI